MKLGDLLDKELVLPTLSARTKTAVLAELVGVMAGREGGLDEKAALNVLLEREKLGTTGIGDGIAIPHGKMDDLSDILVAVGRSVEGVDFEALDHKPCHIFFLVLAPEQVAGMHLRVLAHISRLLKDEQFRTSFMAAGDGDELWRVLKGA